MQGVTPETGGGGTEQTVGVAGSSGGVRDGAQDRQRRCGASDRGWHRAAGLEQWGGMEEREHGNDGAHARAGIANAQR